MTASWFPRHRENDRASRRLSERRRKLEGPTSGDSSPPVGTICPPYRRNLRCRSKDRRCFVFLPFSAGSGASSRIICPQSATFGNNMLEVLP